MNFSSPPTSTIYSWCTGESFLIRSILKEAGIVEASLDDTVDSVLDQLPERPGYFAFHLNCTRTSGFPRCREELIAALLNRGFTVLNRHVSDISKRHIQNRCQELGLPSTFAEIDGNPDEEIMVKTNLNFAGMTEYKLSDSEREHLGLEAPSNLIWNSYHYFVKRREEIEKSIWDSENHICERFIVNRDHAWYRAYCFLNRVVLCEMTSLLQVKKVEESRLQRVWFLDFGDPNSCCEITDPFLETMMADLKTFIDGMQIDFGTVDMVRDDEGRFYVIDLNNTPAYNRQVEGLTEYLRSPLPENI